MVGRGKTDEAPKFTGPIKSVVVDEGQSATFQAIVSGKPSPDIKWYKDEEEVVNSRDYDISYKHGRAILKIPKVKEKHIGTYKCEASNESGKAECTAQLQTKGSNQSPQFTKKLESQVTSEGHSVRFEVIVSGVPPPTVTWSHNGDVLENSVDIQIKSEGNKHSLFIPEVFDDDAGKYQVKAESTTGMATCEATLVVNPAASGDQGPPPQKPVTQTPPQVEEQTPPPPQEEIQKTEEAVTESTPVVPPQTPPKFVKTLSDVKATEGSPVKLECVVKGEPEPTVQWLREDLPIDPSPDFDMFYKDGTATFNIHEIYLDDAGKFSCSAVNPAGTITTSCKVSVEAKPAPKPAAPPPPPKEEEKPKKKTPIAPPEFIKHLEPGRFSEGQPAHFFCQVSGEPKPDVTWYRNGQEIQSGYRFLTRYDKESGRAELEITMLFEEDQGTYTATAKSKAGQISSSAPLLPEAQYDKYIREKREAEEVAEAKAKRTNINAQLADAFKEEKLVPSQRGRPGEVFDDDEGPIMSPFEKRLLKEAAAREAQVESKRPRISQSDERKPSPFEQRLSQEISQRGGTDHVDSRAREPFDLAAFEAHLLQEPDKGTTAVPEETEFESEMETDSEKVSAPRFVKEMKNYRVQEGANLNLGCRVEGVPKPTLQWFKDGQPLYRSTRHDLRYVEGHCSLHIELVLPEDEGCYTVLATSPAGRGVSTGRVVVERAGTTSEIPQHMKGVMAARVHMESEAYAIPQREKYSGDVTEKHYKPKFKEVPSNVAVKEGKLTRFDCRVTGRPPPDLTWYRNGQQVFNDSSHKMLTNEGGYQSLLIPYTVPTDAGVYECIARNKAGEASFSVRLDVEAKADMVAPSFIDRIENVTVNEGEPICFSCKVNGLPMPQVNWQKDGSHIRPGHPSFRSEQDEHGNCRLLVERASKRDAGWITCTAFNKAGRVACRAKLTVKSARDSVYPRAPAAPPRRISRPQPVQEPDTVPSYVQPETYSDDEDFFVKPVVQKPEFIIPLNDMADKKEGDSAHFACRLKNAKDASTRVDWYKNGQPIFVGSRIKTSNEFGICTLDIRGLYPEDSGTIVCRASNASGVAETSGRLVCQGKASLILESQLPAEMRGIEKTLEQEEALLRGDFVDHGDAFPEPEAEPPIFVKVPEPVCVREGEPARFSCRVTGHPQPRILWYKGDTLLVTTSRMKVSYDGIHTLDIPKTRPYDSGIIKMVAHNNVGQAVFQTSLEVLPRGDPSLHLKPTKPEVKDPRLLKKEPVGKELQHAFTERKTHSTKLTTNLRPAPPKEKPQKPVPPKPVQNSPVFVYSPPSYTSAGIGDPLKLTAQISGNPSPKVTWFKDGHPLDPDNRIKMLQDNNNFTLLIVEALPEDSGSYQIDAVNPSGSASQSFSIDVKGGTSLPRQAAPEPDMPKQGSPPVFEHGLTDIEVPEGCPVELACQVVGDPEPEIIWYCNGAIIKPSRYFQMGYQDSIASLIINEVFPEDEGTYTCEAVNDLGSNVSHSHLKVQGALSETESL